MKNKIFFGLLLTCSVMIFGMQDTWSGAMIKKGVSAGIYAFLLMRIGLAVHSISTEQLDYTFTTENLPYSEILPKSSNSCSYEYMPTNRALYCEYCSVNPSTDLIIRKQCRIFNYNPQYYMHIGAILLSAVGLVGKIVFDQCVA